jgi:hypothetical protein
VFFFRIKRASLSASTAGDVHPLFRNIRCFRFVKQMYLDTF